MFAFCVYKGDYQSLSLAYYSGLMIVKHKFASVCRSVCLRRPVTKLELLIHNSLGKQHQRSPNDGRASKTIMMIVTPSWMPVCGKTQNLNKTESETFFLYKLTSLKTERFRTSHSAGSCKRKEEEK